MSRTRGQPSSCWRSRRRTTYCTRFCEEDVIAPACTCVGARALRRGRWGRELERVLRGNVAVLMSEEKVVEQLQRDGAFDELRQLAVDSLLTDSNQLAEHARERARHSNALSAGASRKSKRELFDQVRSEIEDDVMARASAATWRVLTDTQSSDIAFQIAEKVEEVEYKLAPEGVDEENMNDDEHDAKVDVDMEEKEEEEEEGEEGGEENRQA